MSEDDAVRQEIIRQVRFDKDPSGLVPAVVQDAATKDVLMLGFMNRDALEMTLDKGHVTFWTRSRGRLWTKGESSGNLLLVQSLRINCNDDSLLILATPAGPTCHTGHPSCYYREATSAGPWREITSAQFDPEAVYGAK